MRNIRRMLKKDLPLVEGGNQQKINIIIANFLQSDIKLLGNLHNLINSK